MKLEEVLAEVAAGNLSVAEAALRIRQMFTRPQPPRSPRPPGQRSSGLVPALIFTGTGLICTALAIGFGVWAVNFSAGALRTEGTVLRLQMTDNKGNRAPVVRYLVQEKPYEFQSRHSSNPPAYAVGDKVTVMYQPERPGDGYIDSFFELWFMPLLLGLFGLVFGGVGIGVFIALFRRPPLPMPPPASLPATEKPVQPM